MKKLLTFTLLFSLVFIISGCGKAGSDVEITNFEINEVPVTVSTVDFEMEQATIEEKAEIEKKESELEPLPSTYDTDVLFASQAPFANWSLPYQEACEEASLIMAYKYFANQALDKKIMDDEIKGLVEWQLDNFGYYTDTNLEEVAIIANEYFNLDVEISDNVSIENIKRQLVNGNLIIIPASGRDLGNPNFTTPGPLFHMLVIRGYDRNEFITNDPGTRKGLKFKYKYQTLIDAIHDLPIIEGKKFRPYEEESVADSVKLSRIRSGPKQILIIKGLIK